MVEQTFHTEDCLVDAAIEAGENARGTEVLSVAVGDDFVDCVAEGCVVVGFDIVVGGGEFRPQGGVVWRRAVLLEALVQRGCFHDGIEIEGIGSGLRAEVCVRLSNLFERQAFLHYVFI